ncbi:MAG: haloacid dehalogenase-like hydrolase [Chlorobi bacterium]|nr:haloacid dehalogenase-like hydrolase [Chlorobiota bacterium]
MKILVKLVLIVFVSLYVFSSCESCSGNRGKNTKTIVREKIDTVIVEDTKEKKITKVIYDTVFIAIEPDKMKDETEKEMTTDPLPSWNDTPSKQEIINFVKAVTDMNSRFYVKPGDRIAAFDQEGTLWPEKPLYFQIEFMFDRIKELWPEHPEWKKDRLVKAALERDIEKIQKAGSEGLFRLSTLTQANMTVEEYSEVILNWINKAKHPETGMLYKDMVYKPMLELIAYLKDNGFKVYIVTESGLGFIRPWVKQVYGVPVEQVVGSRRRLIWKNKDGKHVLMRDKEILFINDKVNKVISLEQIVGKRPVLAFGNSDNDIFMLRWTNEGEGRRLVGLIHHTDAQREWAYDKDSKIGHLEKGLDIAEENNWLVVDMKKDWKSIYQ